MSTRAAFPYAVTPAGPTMLAHGPDALAQMLMQIIMVEPGERLNRPQFGSPLKALVFEASNSEVTAAYSALIQSALHRWSEGRFHVIKLDIQTVQETALVNVTYQDTSKRTTHTLSLPYDAAAS